jgi:hypothetical protein
LDTGEASEASALRIASPLAGTYFLQFSCEESPASGIRACLTGQKSKGLESDAMVEARQ